jgi:hypothetical protein
VDAVVEDTVYACGDLAAEPRWPEFGRRVSAELCIASQNSNRKVHDIAVEVADTGVLTLPHRMHPGQRRDGRDGSR